VQCWQISSKEETGSWVPASWIRIICVNLTGFGNFCEDGLFLVLHLWRMLWLSWVRCNYVAASPFLMLVCQSFQLAIFCLEITREHHTTNHCFSSPRVWGCGC
jgi:hypothetical protein